MIAILGGGITALAAAMELQKRGLDFILLEADERCGGKIYSKIKDGFLMEMGPNTVLINNPETEQFIKDLNLEDELIFSEQDAVRRRWILKNGKREAIPYSLTSALSSKVFGFGTLLSIISEPFKKKKADENEESLADFSRRRLGKQIYEDLITPFVSGIYAGDPERMSIDHTLSLLKQAEIKGGSILRGMKKVLQERSIERKGWKGSKNKIFSFKGGLERLSEAASERLKEKINLQTKIEKIIKEEKGYRIIYTQNGSFKELEADRIISTIPAPVLAKVIFDERLSTALQKINYVPALVCHFGIKKEDLLIKEPSFGLLSRKVEKVPFLGVLFNSYFFPHASRPDEFLITVISGGYRQPDMIHKSNDEILEEIYTSLIELEIVKEDPKMQNVYKWEKAIPQYELGYSDFVEEMELFEAQNPTFKLGGNYNKGISVSDCIAKGTKLAAEIN